MTKYMLILEISVNNNGAKSDYHVVENLHEVFSILQIELTTSPELLIWYDGNVLLHVCKRMEPTMFKIHTTYDLCSCLTFHIGLFPPIKFDISELNQSDSDSSELDLNEIDMDFSSVKLEGSEKKIDFSVVSKINIYKYLRNDDMCPPAVGLQIDLTSVHRMIKNHYLVDIKKYAKVVVYIYGNWVTLDTNKVNSVDDCL